MMPNFLIVGAAKSGTTSLYRYLRQHPDIFMPEWKELSFFTGDPFGPLHKVKNPAHYHTVFSRAQTQTAVGEASTSYLYDKSAPRLIYEALGEIKILIILRNPVKMSYSLYNHQVRKEGETLKTFEKALAAETSRMNDLNFKQKCYGWHANYYYFTRSQYFVQVKRYLDIFPRENIKIIVFEEFIKNTLNSVQDIFKFLKVDHTFVPEIKVHNPAGGIISIPKFWSDIGLFLKTAQFVFSKNLLRKIPYLIRNKSRKLPGPIKPETEIKFKKKCLEDICRLEQLIERDLLVWKN